LKAEADRLLRLANTHGKMIQVLEIRITRLRLQIEELDRRKAAMMDAIERGSVLALVFYAAATRRLGEIEATKVSAERAMEELRHKLFSMSGRRDILMRRTAALTAVDVRKGREEEAREVALRMKATGKHGVMR